MHNTFIYNVSMRQAYKQKEFPASTLISYRYKNVDASRPTFKVLAGNLYSQKQENAHRNSERYHYSMNKFFPPASF